MKKCVICKQPIDDESLCIPYKNRLAHKTCFNSMVGIATTVKKEQQKEKKQAKKKQVSKPKVETVKDAVSEEEYKEKVELYDYIREVFKISKIQSKTYALVERYKQLYNFTYEGIRQTLEYYYVIMDNPKTEDCMGIVPYVYGEADKYFEDIKCIEASLDNKHIENMYNKKVVLVGSRKKQKPLLLDIESVGRGES